MLFLLGHTFVFYLGYGPAALGKAKIRIKIKFGFHSHCAEIKIQIFSIFERKKKQNISLLGVALESTRRH